MNEDTIRGVVSFFVLCFALFASQPVYTQDSKEIVFRPLCVGERISSRVRVEGDVLTMSIYRIDQGGREAGEVLCVQGTVPTNATITNGGRRAFFIALAKDPDGFDRLWVVDGDAGKALPILDASPAFAVSVDGRFICYDDLPHQIQMGNHFPTITLYDYEQDRVVARFDFQEKKYQGTGVDIAFCNKTRSFRLVFGVESEVRGTEKVALPIDK